MNSFDSNLSPHSLKHRNLTEWQAVTKRAFISWINFNLNSAGYESIENIDEDLRDGIILIRLINHLSENANLTPISSRNRSNTVQLLTSPSKLNNDIKSNSNIDRSKLLRFENLNIVWKQFIEDKIDLIKIDTNGSEYQIVDTLLNLIKRDKPVLIIENNNISKIYDNLKKLGYKKYYVIDNKIKTHSNQNSANIIFK